MDNIYNAIQNLYNMDKTTWQEVLAELYNLVANVENKFDLFELKFGSLLGEQVTRELKKMYDDGSLASLINEVLLQDINEKVDTFKTEVSEQVDTFKTEVDTFKTEVSEQLEDKTNLTNKRIEVINETGDVKGVIDLANFAGQGTAHKDIMAKLHNYTDSDVMWLDNVGEGNTILRLNNSRNPIRRADKGNDYVGSGDYLILGRHKNDGSIYYQVLIIDKDGNFMFNNNSALTGAIKFDNNKLASDGEPGFIFRTPSATHNEVLKLKTGGSDRELFSFGGHASGDLALINVGPLMTYGLAITFTAITETQHLKFGTADNPYTVPNVIVKGFPPTNITPHFIGQMFVNTIDKSVYMATEVVTGGWTKLSN